MIKTTTGMRLPTIRRLLGCIIAAGMGLTRLVAVSPAQAATVTNGPLTINAPPCASCGSATIISGWAANTPSSPVRGWTYEDYNLGYHLDPAPGFEPYWALTVTFTATWEVTPSNPRLTRTGR